MNGFLKIGLSIIEVLVVLSKDNLISDCVQIVLKSLHNFLCHLLVFQILGGYLIYCLNP